MKAIMAPTGLPKLPPKMKTAIIEYQGIIKSTSTIEKLARSRAKNA